MGVKLVGQIIYLDLGEIEEYRFNKYELKELALQQIKDASIIDFKNDGTQKVIFDIEGNDDYWGGYVKGFFYSDGKFVGNFHYISDAKMSVEPLNGKYKQMEESYEIRGKGYQEGFGQFAFYISLGSPSNQEEGLSEKLPFHLKPVKAIARRRRLPKNNPVLNKPILRLIATKAKSKKKKKTRTQTRYDLYNHIVNLKPVADSVDNILIAMCVAYSWMPTMLDIYVEDRKALTKLLPVIKGLGSISSVYKFDKQSKNIETWLIHLTQVINNSTVGATKVLHIFYPNHIPIIDSNVLRGWNIIFKKYYKKHPELKLPTRISAVSKSNVTTYMKYWRLLLTMMDNTKSKSIRKLEEPFYWIGME